MEYSNIYHYIYVSQCMYIFGSMQIFNVVSMVRTILFKIIMPWNTLDAWNTGALGAQFNVQINRVQNNL